MIELKLQDRTNKVSLEKKYLPVEKWDDFVNYVRRGGRTLIFNTVYMPEKDKMKTDYNVFYLGYPSERISIRHGVWGYKFICEKYSLSTSGKWDISDDKFVVLVTPDNFKLRQVHLDKFFAATVGVSLDNEEVLING